MDVDIMGQDDFIGEVIVEISLFNFRDILFYIVWYFLNMEV